MDELLLTPKPAANLVANPELSWCGLWILVVYLGLDRSPYSAKRVSACTRYPISGMTFVALKMKQENNRLSI